MYSTEYATVWLCIDCTVKHENDDNPTEATPYVPLQYIEGHLSANWGGHDEDGETDPNEGIHDFSSAICDGCGSPLAGARYRYAEWTI